MQAVTIRSNAKNLMRSLVEKKLSVRAGAKAAGISRKSFANIVRRDEIISPKMAGKLRATFGDDVIYISAADDFRRNRECEIAELQDMRAELEKNFPDDKQRLQTLDALIRANRDALKLAVEGKGGDET